MDGQGDPVQMLFDVMFPYNAGRLDDIKQHGRKFAHYTTAETALAILSGECIWLRNVEVMNDHSEISHGTGLLRQALEGQDGRDFIDLINTVHDGISNTVVTWLVQETYDARATTYMTSLCEHGPADWLGTLSMWRSYGGPTAGVALILNAEPELEPGIDMGTHLSPVLYGGHDEFNAQFKRVLDGLRANLPLLASVKDMTAAQVIVSALQFALLSSKHKGFAEEKEWRVLYLENQHQTDSPVKRRVRSIGGVPQVVYELPLNKRAGVPQLNWDKLLHGILIGPSLYPEVIQRAFQVELKRLGVGRFDQIVEISDIPLRQWH